MANEAFFGPNGLTTTSASYLKNLAQEQTKSAEVWFEQMKLYSEYKTILSQGKEILTNKSNVKSLESISDESLYISKLYWFIAWVGEAIKRKELAVRSIPGFETWAGDRLPSHPDRLPDVDDLDIIAEFDAEKMTKYLRLQQMAAVLGKLIHERGAIASARKAAYRVSNAQSSIDQLSNDLVITRYQLEYPLEEIDEVYNQLQAKRREYDKQLNQIKFEVKDEVNRRNKEADLAYHSACEEWSAVMSQLRTEYTIWYREKKAEIEAWKIVIPEGLQPMLKYLQSLGKVDK